MQLIAFIAEPTRRLWHQVLHRHPQVGGYVTRAPERLERLLPETPALRPFFGDGGALPSRPETLRALQELNVRFVIVDGPRLAAARALRVPVAYQGDGITVFEVPAAAHARRAMAAGRRARSASSELVATDLLPDEPEVQPRSVGVHERTERGARDG